MAKIIGRENEEQTLEEAYQEDSAQMIALYGRRRVGKTYLIKNFFAKKEKEAHLFYVTGTKGGTPPEQLQNFCGKFTTFGTLPGARVEVQRNWREAFEVLTHNMKLCKKKKIVLFFDEFPWMATKGSRLLRTLETYWNDRWADDPRIKLIICGSASNWILKNIINNKGGLYNRVNHSIKLEPFNLYQTKEYFRYKKIKLNDRDITDLYMAIGGVPFYLSKVKEGLSAAQNIEQLAFKQNSFLLKEFENLYHTLFNTGESHITLARKIAAHRYGVEQKKLGKPGGTLTKHLNELEQAGFIIKLTPFKHKKKKVYYKMIDEYSLFYFRWIEPIKEILYTQGMKKGYWQNIHRDPRWYSWSGYAFEAICLKHHLQISEALNLSPSDLPYTWRYAPKPGSDEKGTQIDLLFDRRDNAITICEIKYTREPFALDKYGAQKLRQAIEVFKKQTKTKKNIFVALVSAAGVTKTMYFDDFIGDNGIVTLKDLFKHIETW